MLVDDESPFDGVYRADTAPVGEVEDPGYFPDDLAPGDGEPTVDPDQGGGTGD